jgi:hypothetical protein
VNLFQPLPIEVIDVGPRSEAGDERLQALAVLHGGIAAPVSGLPRRSIFPFEALDAIEEGKKCCELCGFEGHQGFQYLAARNKPVGAAHLATDRFGVAACLTGDPNQKVVMAVAAIALVDMDTANLDTVSARSSVPIHATQPRVSAQTMSFR